jgi:hypothetical protein
MEIPSVTETQIAMMREVTADSNMTVFSQRASDPTDPLDSAVKIARANDDAQILASLGFLKEITMDHASQIEKMNTDTGHKWRVYLITAMGRAMFQIATSGAPN